MSTTIVTTSQSMTEVFKILAAPIVGHYCNRAKTLSIIALGAPIWIAGSIVLGSTANGAMLFIGFGLIGAGFSFLTVLTPAILTDAMADRSRVPFLLGIIYGTASLGVAIFFLVCGVSVSAWRWDFFAAAALTGIPMLILGKTAVKDTCGSSERLAAEMKKTLEPEMPLLPALKRLCATPCFPPILMMITCESAFVNANVVLLSKFIEEGLGKSKETASFVLAATVPATIVGTVLGGWMVKKWEMGLRAQLKFCAITNAIVIPMVPVIFLSGNFWVAVPFIVVGMLVVFLSAAPAISLIALAVPSKRYVSRAQSLANVIPRSLGSIPGPIILGALIDGSGSGYSFSDSYLIVGLVGLSLTVLGAVIALCLAPDAHFADAEPEDDDENAQPAATAAVVDAVVVPGAAVATSKAQNDDEEMSSKAVAATGHNHPTIPEMPVIRILEPSPARGSEASSSSHANPLREREAAAADWQAAGLLQKPENNFLAEAEELEPITSQDDFL